MREISRQARSRGERIGLVPTMGCLHAGHMSLLRRVRSVTEVLVVSVFVNPTQFTDHEDFEKYPRDLARDSDLSIAEGVDYLFTPESAEIYPPGSSTFVEVAELSSLLEGASRPGHFRGVTTVVLKLFEIVTPHVAAFGQKDAQQAIIIQRMARELMLGLEVLVLPTVRDEDRVALSSRNGYLSSEERRAAAAIPRCLEAAERAIAEGERDPAIIVRAAREVLRAESSLRVDYLELVETETLQPVSRIEGEMLLAVAVVLGGTRLIDNTVLRV